MISGITVEQVVSSADLDLKLNQDYLGAFSTMPGIFWLFSAAGNSSLFELNGGKLSPHGPADHSISRSMKKKYGNDYRAIVSDITARFPKSK